MDIQRSYDAWSATYDTDRNLTRDLDAEVTRSALGKARYQSILEIGCGTGKNTGWLSTIGKKVLAVDFSHCMLEQARTNVRTANVTFSMADITKPWPCDDGAFDLVACNLVLEHISDLSVIFPEALRSLAAGGTFFVCELHPFRQYLGTRAEYQGSAGITEINSFVHHLSDFLDAARNAGFTLAELKEWWHKEDNGKPPRLASFVFRK